MSWSKDYKKSIDCGNPKGFSQKAHCAARKKRRRGEETKSKSPFSEQVEMDKMRYCKLCRKVEQRDECSYGPAMWDRYSLPSNPSAVAMSNPHYHANSPHPANESIEILEGKRDGKSAKDKDYSLRDWFKGGGWVQAGGKYDGKPCAKQPGQKTKPFCRDADDRAAMSKDEREKRANKKRKEDPNPNRKGKAKFVTVEQIGVQIPLGKDGLKKVMEPLMKQHGGGKLIEPPSKSANVRNAHFELKGELIDEKKDACYSKVKSRYKVWPSAYASGALVKCRKIGASNWGTKSESTESLGYDWDTTIRERADRYCPKCEKMELRSECRYGPRYWDMFSVPSELIGSKKDYGITMPYAPYAYSENVKETYEFSNWRDEFFPTEIESFDIIKPEPIKGVREDKDPCWDGYKQVGMKKKGGRMVPNCVKEGYSNWREELSEDWQKVNRKDKTDGLSQAAVDAYRRENPGSKLQTAVTEKKPTGKRAKRRANFCRRMKGMKSKLTSAKTARDPDSRINKALRRWNCN